MKENLRDSYENLNRKHNNLITYLEIGVFTVASSIGIAMCQTYTFDYRQKEAMLTAHQEYVDGDSLSDLVIKDGNGTKKFVLYGQEDGSYKNKEQIEYKNKK